MNAITDILEPEVFQADQVARAFLERVEAERRERCRALQVERDRAAQSIYRAIRTAPCE